MPKMNSAQLTDVSGSLSTQPEEKDADGLEGRDESGAASGVRGESKSEDVLEGIVAILDSLEHWQQSRKVKDF
ncbi:hypothetical protein [Desulfonatronum sp. SC1]|uniref:hypothetical protein n=1 Tax=Desulfonatronum sp. SC1 TaxID=2109626 RepID=UPI000D30C740|nr:hypothetical protein [Desulfonatronum sp. SC1]PTN37552.1 hypothetical protein C6366_06235 [Desulfonatronum sp. SC1]